MTKATLSQRIRYVSIGGNVRHVTVSNVETSTLQSTDIMLWDDSITLLLWDDGSTDLIWD